MSDIEHHNDLQRNSLAVFIDTTEAYDNTEPPVVIRWVAGCDQFFIREVLRKHHICFRLGSVPSEKRALMRGPLQGCVLCTLLCNVAMSDLVPLPPGLLRNARLSIFADDLCPCS